MRGLGLFLRLWALALSETIISFYDFASWAVGNPDVTLSDNTQTGPYGATDAALLSEQATTSTHGIGTSCPLVAGKTYTLEVIAAPGTKSTAMLSVFDGAVHQAHINLSTGAIGTQTNVVSVSTDTAGLANGYRRFRMRWVANSTGTAFPSIYVTDPAEVVTYLGVITNNIKIHSAVITSP